MKSNGSVIGSKYLKPFYGRISDTAKWAVLQVLYDKKRMSSFKSRAENILEISYDKLCANPEKELELFSDGFYGITGERPVKKCGFEPKFINRTAETGTDSRIADFVAKYENCSEEELEKILFGENNEHP